MILPLTSREVRRRMNLALMGLGLVALSGVGLAGSLAALLG